MKKVFFIGLIFTLSSCAFVEGRYPVVVKDWEKKNSRPKSAVVPVPKASELVREKHEDCNTGWIPSQYFTPHDISLRELCVESDFVFNVKVTHKVWYIPLIWGSSCQVYEGDCVKK